MKTGMIAAFAAIACFAQPLYAQQDGPPTMKAATAPAEPDAIALYGSKGTGATTTEVWSLFGGRDHVVRNVTRPTLTPFLPDPAKATGAAVIVAPGGAFMLLAIDHEGWRVARALADRGVAAFVLKYRLIPTPKSEAEAHTFMMRTMMEGIKDPTKPPSLQHPPSTQDGLAALAMVRANSAKWGIDPKRVGMIGFSAGAMTSINTVLASSAQTGPDFIGYIYGPQAAVDVPAHAPPMFDAIALDDPLFKSMGFPIAEAWLAAKKPVELHAYGKGSHGFGLGMPGTTTTQMLDQFIGWMDMQGFLKSKVQK